MHLPPTIIIPSMAGAPHHHHPCSLLLNYVSLLLTHLLAVTAAAANTALPNQPTTTRFFTGMFVFGSSTVDVGNNNYLLTRAKVNYTPYGIDFPSSASTGRFSNGNNIVDLVGQRLNLPLIKPFLDPSNTEDEIDGGVNYGSGAAGLLSNTGTVLGQVICWEQQVNNFERITLPQLNETSSGEEELLSRYLFLLVPSGNDYQGNYFRGGTSANVTVEAFTSSLISQFSCFLERLYLSGGRNFLIINMFPIGCVPFVRINNNNNECNETLNTATNLFNSQLPPLLDNFKHEHAGFEFVLVSSYKIISDIIQHPFRQGFSNVSAACCELDDIRLFCKRDGSVCPDRSNYVFFDAQHLSTAAADVIASKAYSSDLRSEAYPFSLRQLELRRSLSQHGIIN